MRRTGRAKCLGAHVRAVLNARDGVFLQLGAFGAERNGPKAELHAHGLIVASLFDRMPAAMMPTTSQRNHLRHHLGLALTFACQLRCVDRARH